MIFRHILFPVDFSERCRASAPDVRAACARFGASLTLLHLVKLPVTVYPELGTALSLGCVAAPLVAEARALLTEFGASLFPGMNVKLEVEEGDPGPRLAELAVTLGCDLIMLPTHGRGVFQTALLGSVTARTLHLATCPVWTQAHSEEAGGEHADWKNVICAVDSTTEAKRLVGFAAILAQGCGVGVRIVHAVPQSQGPEQFLDGEFAEFLREQARSRIAFVQRSVGTAFDAVVESGPVPEVLRDAARAWNADLVLVGRGLLPRVAGALRPHVYPIVRSVPCPVLSV